MTITIYHNPRCSKSRQALEIIREHGEEPEIIEYLKNPLSAQKIAMILKQLGIENPRDLMRKGEAAYKENNLADESLSHDTLVSAMAEHPILIERPIITSGKGTIIGRPPESVKNIL